MDKSKRKKIYYIPGILSLSILPLLLIHFTKEEHAIRMITILIADTNLPKKIPEVFKYYKETYPPKRNYTGIVLTGNEKYDRIKFEFAQIRIREILSANDSINGVHFQFSDSSVFGTFVKAIDILRFEKAKSYMILEKDVWFFHVPPDTTIVNLDLSYDFIGM